MARESVLRIALDASGAKQGAREFGTAVATVEDQATKATKAADGFEKELKETGAAADQAKGKVSGAATAIAQSEKSMTLAERAALALKGSIGGLVAGYAGLATVQKAVGYITAFEAAVKKIQVIGGLDETSDAFKATESTARELGRSTQFGAGEVAGGLLELTKAGLEASDAIKTIKPALDLAVAGDISLGKASEVLLATLAQFQFSAQESTRVADVLVKQANASQSSVDGLAEGFRVVGPLANALGVTFEETAALLGVLNDNAIKASDAGTGLKTVLAALLQPTSDTQAALADLGLNLKDIDPRVKGLSGVFRTLGAAGLDAGNAFRLFGSFGATVGTVLAANIEKAEKYNETLKESAGTSSEVAGAVGDTLGGAFKELTGSIEDLAIALGEAGLTAVLRGAAELTKGIANDVSGIAKSTKELINAASASTTYDPTSGIGQALYFSAAPINAPTPGISREDYIRAAFTGRVAVPPPIDFAAIQSQFVSASDYLGDGGFNPNGPSVKPIEYNLSTPFGPEQAPPPDQFLAYPSTGSAFGPDQGALDALRQELETRRELIGATEQQKEVAAALADIQKAAESQYGVGTPEAAAAVEEYRGQLEQVLRIEEAYADAVEASADETKKAREEAEKRIGIIKKQNEKLADAIGDPISSGINGAFQDILNGEDLDAAAIGRKIGNDILLGLIDELITSVLVALIKKLILSLLDTNTGGVSSVVAEVANIKAANGAVIDGGNVVPYAQGGYVTNGPEYFPLTGGKIGLRGEAGPEIIAPAVRGPDGKLGIRNYGGGGVTVNQFISTPDADSFRKSRQHMLADEKRARSRYGVS